MLKRSLLIYELVVTAALIGVALVAVRMIMQGYHVSGVSMQPGLTDGQYVMVNRIAYWFHRPARGDVVVFHNPQNSSEDLVKRIIGLPGDTVTTDSTHIWVNDVLLDEKAYVNAAPPNTPLNPSAKTWHIPPDQYFVVGDNRPVSFDSRYLGPIPKDYIVGSAAFVSWPIFNIHLIDTHSDVFAKIKNP
jgi:signal peptidase I